MKRALKYLYIIIPFFVLGFAYATQTIRLKNFALDQLRIQVQRKIPFEVVAGDLELTFFWPGARLLNVRVTPLGGWVESIPKPMILPTVTIYLDIPKLLIGNIEVGSIEILDPKMDFIFPKNNEPKSSKTPLPSLWPILSSLPFKGLQILRGDIGLTLPEQKMTLNLKRANFGMEREYSDLSAELFLPEILINSEPTQKLSIAAGLRIDPNQLDIYAFKISHLQSSLLAKLLTSSDLSKLTPNKLIGRAVANLDLTELFSLKESAFPNFKFPKVSGKLRLQSQINPADGPYGSIDGKFGSEALTISEFTVGNLQTAFSLKGDSLSLPLTQGNWDGTRINLQNTKIKVLSPYNFETRVIGENVEIPRFLRQIDVKNVPLELNVKAVVPCIGQIEPEVTLKCAGDAVGSGLRVYDKSDNKTIVALKEFSITSELEVNKTKVTFPRAILQVGSSKGEASGEVEYERGFNFKYKTDSLDFADVKSLGDLKFVGVLALEGVTSGNSDVGTFEMKVKSQDFAFENYTLGNLETDLKYEKGTVYLSDAKGKIGESLYTGYANIQLRTPVGIDTKIEAPTLEIADLATVFKDRVQLPFHYKGKGKASLQAKGPLNLSQLTYTLSSFAENGTVLGENFKRAQFDVHAIDGHCYADHVYVSKGGGGFDLTGDVKSSGDMNVTIKSRDLRVSDFDHVQNVSRTLDGRVSMTMILREFILRPQTALRATVKDASLNFETFGDLETEIKTSPEGMYFSASMPTNNLSARLVYPFIENGPFSFNFNSENWDFSRFLYLIAGGVPRHDFEASLTASANLASPRGGLWTSTGSLSAKKFYVRHGTSFMQNKGALAIDFQEGVMAVKNFIIEGDDTQLKLTGNRQKNDQLNLTFGGRIDISLLTFLTPFFRDMGGSLSLNSQIAGTVKQPEVLGTAYIKKAHVRLDEFPHPFEELNMDLAFSQKQVQINTGTGRLGGGNLTYTGTIGFESFGNIPVKLIGELKGTTLKVPQGLTTSGDLHYLVSGSWFPYTLKGDYLISSGLFSREFDAAQTENTIQRSSYLPSAVLKEHFYPIELDIFARFLRGVQVKNKLVEAEARGTLEVKGNPSFSLLTGEVELAPNGKILFRDNAFAIQTTKVKFNNVPPEQAELYTLATSRVRDWDIQLVAQGTLPYRMQLTSTPPLTEQSIVSLLALGITVEEGNREAGGQVQGYQAGNLVLSQAPLQKELSDSLGVDVKLSQNVENIDVGQQVVTPKVVAEKKWSKKLSTSYSRSIGATERGSQDYNIEYKLTKNISVLGSYQQRDYDVLGGSAAGTPARPASNVLGLDLQYKYEFR